MNSHDTRFLKILVEDSRATPAYKQELIAKLDKAHRPSWLERLSEWRLRRDQRVADGHEARVCEHRNLSECDVGDVSCLDCGKDMTR